MSKIKNEKKYKKLQKEFDGAYPDGYRKARELFESSRNLLCEELANHIQQRHQKILEQYQVLDGITGEYNDAQCICNHLVLLRPLSNLTDLVGNSRLISRLNQTSRVVQRDKKRTTKGKTSTISYIPNFLFWLAALNSRIFHPHFSYFLADHFPRWAYELWKDV